MEIIEIYLLFALTTGISSCVLFLAPAVALAKDTGVENSFTENTWLSYLIYITITSITAPFAVLPIFIPSFSERFKIGLERAVMESQT
jgi:uncharacterized membrane protein YdjX (TVP38/TMEM64 family)